MRACLCGVASGVCGVASDSCCWSCACAVAPSVTVAVVVQAYRAIHKDLHAGLDVEAWQALRECAAELCAIRSRH